jgi:site-specific recombinase XerD
MCKTRKKPSSIRARPFQKIRTVCAGRRSRELEITSQETARAVTAPELTSKSSVVDELLTHDEARHLIRSASNRAPTGIRNRALIAMMYRVGLRPGEVLALDVRDINLDEGTVSIPARKSGAGRVTGIDAQTVDLVRRWIARRERLGIADAAFLFCTLAGEELKAAYVRELLPRLARRAEITKRVHPLGLRYACAAEMSAEGFSTALIEMHLGVAVSGSARRYLVQYSQEEVIAAVRSREWRL